MSVRVVVLGMLDSIHLAKWLEHFRDESISFFLIPSSPHRRIHPRIKALLTESNRAGFQTFKAVSVMGLPLWLADRILGNLLRSFLLLRIIKKWRPEYVHALEIQNAGYIALRAWEQDPNLKPKLLVTNYGSDIYWFARQYRHRDKISRLLERTYRYACECERDVKLAQELGFSGEVMPVQPNAGGFSPEEVLAQEQDQDRKTIALKGYQGWVGRAVTALDAIEMAQEKLQGYKIEIYSCNRATILRAKELARSAKLEIVTYRKGQLSQPEMVDLFSRARVYVGISESDGISTSLLEAMAYGAIPVQTATACCDEWFETTGVRVTSINAPAIAEGIIRALELSRNPKNAIQNRSTVLERASQANVRKNALLFYRGSLTA